MLDMLFIFKCHKVLILIYKNQVEVVGMEIQQLVYWCIIAKIIKQIVIFNHNRKMTMV
jgi:hypothetical protein